MTRISFNRLVPALGLLLAGGPAAAHTGAHDLAGFAGGLLHPFAGLDHLLAMLAVGAWAAQQRREVRWQAPLAFIVALLAGAGLAGYGVALPYVEPVLALTVLVAGLLVAAAWRSTWPAGAALAAGFAVFHGYAHGLEMPAAALPIAYVGGFAAATATLVAAGLVAGTHLSTRWTRAAGAATAAMGGVLLWFA